MASEEKVRYINVVHYHYDCTEPLDGNDVVAVYSEGVIPSYATEEEAVASRPKDGTQETHYTWAVKVGD